MAIDAQSGTPPRCETSKGSLTIALDAVAAPRTVNSFVFLARNGYYDGVIFHRIIPGFVVQGGDPTGSGRGGPGYQFADELPAPGTLRDRLASDGERGSGHEREPVLHRQRPDGCPAASELLALRQGRRGLETVAALTPSVRSGGSPTERVTIDSVTITEATDHRRSHRLPRNGPIGLPAGGTPIAAGFPFTNTWTVAGT